MKIIVFSQHFWPEKFRINYLVEELSKNNKIKRLSVFTAKPNYPEGKILKGYNKFFFKKQIKKKILIFRSQIIPRGNSSAIKLIFNYISYVIFGLINIFRIKFSYNIVFVYCTSPIFQAIPAIIYSKIKKIPLILWVQDLWPESVVETGYIKNKFSIKIIKIITKIIYKNSDLILVQSRKFIKPIRNLTDTKIKFFPNPSEFKKVNKKKFVYNKSKIMKIYYAGNMGSAQNLKNLIKFCQLTNKKNFKIYLFGDGSQKKWLKNKIRESKIQKKIEVRKFLKDKNFVKEMKKADCFLILLSSGNALSKTIPAKFQTYLYFGKPIISWSDGEVSFITRKYNLGFSAKSNSLKEFSNCIENVSKMRKNQIKKYYYNNTDFFNKHFSLNKCSQDLLKIFKDQINGQNT